MQNICYGDSNGIQTHLVCERTLNRLANLANFLNDFAVLWVFISTVHLTVCYVTYVFQSEYIL